jgi:hypothetical protein
VSRVKYLGTDCVENAVNCWTPITSVETCFQICYSAMAAYNYLLSCCLATKFVSLFRGCCSVTGPYAAEVYVVDFERAISLLFFLQ